MSRRFSVNYAIMSMAFDITLTIVALLLATLLRPFISHFSFIRVSDGPYFLPFMLVVVPILWAASFLLLSVYDPKRNRKLIDSLQGVTVATLVAALLFAGTLYLSLRGFSRALFLTFILFDLVFLIGWRVLSHGVLRLGRFPWPQRRVLIVGAGNVGRRVGAMIQDYEWMGLDLSGYLDHSLQEDGSVLGRVEDVRPVVQKRQINDVVIALPQEDYGHVNRLVLDLHDLPVNVRVVPDYFSLALYRASVEDFGGLPMISLRDPALNEVQRLVKRMFDLAIAVPVVMLLMPIIALISILIKLDSDGPVIFRQQRVGENGQLFPMYKFRSMVVGAEKMQDDVKQTDDEGNVIYKKAGDPRITRIGSFLRRTSLDEVPQLFNVIKGDMSLVGPRPELPMLVGQYEPWQHKRFAVPQGMTGWWQINGRSDKPLHLHTEEDIYYIQNYSLWMDLYILLKTPLAVLRGKGAY